MSSDNPDDWEVSAIRIAAALDLATKELQRLIDEIRKRREKEDEENDAAGQP